MRLATILLFLCATIAHAGKDKPGPPLSNITPLWTNQHVLTVDATTTESYVVGADTKLTADVFISGVDSGTQMFITPLWEFLGGNSVGYPVVDLTSPQTFSWTEGTSPTAFFWEITPPKGAARMYLKANCNEASGVTMNVSVTGYDN